MQTDRRPLLENRVIYLFMRAIRVQYSDSTVDFDLDVHDEMLRNTLGYLSTTFRILY